MTKPRSLLFTWLALMGLLAATAAIAWTRLGWLNPVLALAIALVKASLVACVFMYLHSASRLVRLAAGAGLVTLVLLFSLAAADYATRTDAPASWQRPETVAPRLGGA